ncbi:3-phosphoshikimate 1-carboxyvinyltransferase [Alicyclobacillus dauci]|uniref:3-phosphoshikimate 1-carboxyvinyltransferase n=1 Tax=Alicyclobacillus dauci TaxID=1475485 RepID=A0ABY6Z123_9BACL|nr:3-phosphoshikimate 1-carboxyvinyltransferase [Alicyclobacillus dauci]WAH36542.1 3-phosphoshikimate 1-carboxyvinyltransferase [Alicyclobacillus dauci]
MSSNHADFQARSPWALHDVSQARILPATGPIDADVVVPGSKSFTNRALIVAALAKGTSRLTGLLRSDDAYWCIEALKSLGVDVVVDGDNVTVRGINGRWPHQAGRVYTGAGGTTARFLTSALAAGEGKWTIEGSKRMNERPMGVLFETLQALGVGIHPLSERPDTLPIELDTKGLRGGRVQMSGAVSSQFISGALIGAPYAKDALTIEITDTIVQHAYVHITLDMMRAFGGNVEADEQLHEMTVSSTGYVGRDYDIEADASTACYFWAAAALTGGRVRVKNLTYSTRQPDVQFVDVLEQMGCSVDKSGQGIEVQGPRQLRGGQTISMKEMSDQTLTLAFLAPFADAPVNITEVEHIRHHESDRLAVICESLQKIGIRVDERPDGVTIYPGPAAGTLLSSHDDHRVAMAQSIMGLRVPGIVVDDPGCVSKTCPMFFEKLGEIGVQVELN